MKGDEAPPRMENPMSLGGSSEMMRKKRGRPRKYGADGCLAMVLSVMPISSSIPASREFWPWKQGEMVQKSQHKYEFESSPPARGTFYWVFHFETHNWFDDDVAKHGGMSFLSQLVLLTATFLYALLVLLVGKVI